MTKPIYLYVRQQDIDEGMPSYYAHCPIALSACRRFRGGSVNVLPVDSSEASAWELVVDKPRSQTIYTLPQEAIDFAKAFDDQALGRKFLPFRFRLA